MTRSSRPVRILQVIGKQMNRGGAETWIMHVLRNIDRENFRMDFLVETDKPGDFDEEIRSLGSRTIVCADHHNPAAYATSLRRILNEHGPYDVVHSHHHHFGGYVVFLAAKLGIPVRISHAHGDFAVFDESRSRAWQAYSAVMKRLIRRYTTTGLAVSEGAARDMFGRAWRDDPRWKLLYCGIDLRPFSEEVDSAAIRRELGIPEDALVFGHVGRFFDYKNQDLLIDIAASMARSGEDAYLLMVGHGPTFDEVRARAESSGVSDRTVFAGLRTDIPGLMLGAMDVFVLPSWFEGLPLVGLEAQAAGLPMLLSDVVTTEMDVMTDRIRRLSIKANPPTEWANAILELASIPRDARGSLQLLKSGPFNIDFSVRRLEEIYAASH